jgi:hypothetical protein
MTGRMIESVDTCCIGARVVSRRRPETRFSLDREREREREREEEKERERARVDDER